MHDVNWLTAAAQQQQLQKVLDTNKRTEAYGLVLTQQDAENLLAGRKAVLQETQRVELRHSILPVLIETFCSSTYLHPQNYVETLLRLQEIFFYYKNETMDELTDEELLQVMPEQFDGVCYGDLDYLENTCLDIFAQAVRAGYQGRNPKERNLDFSASDIVPRWDRQLYLDALQELMGWR